MEPNLPKSLFFERPLILEHNRAKRLYLGGAELDVWQGFLKKEDSFFSEDMCVNTGEYIGPGEVFDKGFSQTIIENEKHRLRSLIEAYPREMLGEGYIEKTLGHSGVQCRVGDAKNRLILQYHPTDQFAQKYFSVPFGKTESWYVLNTRGERGYCYVGFKEGVTREEFIAHFDAQDVPKMLSSLNKIEFSKGDLIHIPSGTIHAMGGGSTFLEMHSPCDYTMRFEKHFEGKDIEEDELHYGLGRAKLFEGLSFKTYSDAEIKKLVYSREKKELADGQFELEELLGYAKNKSYRIERLRLKGEFELEKNRSHCIMIMAKGDAIFKTKKDELLVKQGRSIFLPANVEKLKLISEDAEIIIGHPFEV